MLMHGFIFLEFKHYVQSKYDPMIWDQLQQESGIQNQKYYSYETYSDEQLNLLLLGLSKITNKTLAELLEDFGIFIAPILLRTSQHMIKKSWTFLDLLEHTQEMIYARIIKALPGSSPPYLKCIRSGPHEVHIIYDSPRKMCDFAKGLIKGMAAVYTTPITISEPTCMHHGGPYCEIIVQVAVGRTTELSNIA